MNINQLLQAKKEALELVAEIDAQLAAPEHANEAEIIAELAEIDSKIAELQVLRLDPETRLAKARYNSGSVEFMTVREASLATGYGEPTLRTLCNIKKGYGIRIDETGGYGTRIILQSLKDYMETRARGPNR
jgi:hypothetical protein